MYSSVSTSWRSLATGISTKGLKLYTLNFQITEMESFLKCCKSKMFCCIMFWNLSKWVDYATSTKT